MQDARVHHRGAISSTFGIIVTLIIAAGVGGYVYTQSQMPDYADTAPAPPSAPEETACTQEAKQCPDGTYVGRTGPKCEFAACPGEGKNRWRSKETCEQETKKVCDFEMCDYLCPEGFENGWVPTAKPVTQSATSADWKTYQNQQMGFSMQHPLDWSVTPEYSDSGGTRVDFQSPDFLSKLSILHGAFYYSREKGRNFTIEELVNDEKASSIHNDDFKEESILLDGSPAIKISYTGWARASQNYRTATIYEKDHATWIFFSMVEYDASKDSVYDSLLNEILSSFRFTK
ncbi:hypothetical protein HY416_01375 [Candidatus Kaiserbacteria bacterium]|nr:hypothetical protein [Candidatus Kaiserbacteria bacterium]